MATFGTKNVHIAVRRWLPKIALFFAHFRSLWYLHVPPLCFSSLWETTQTLFWAIFGLVDLDNFELTGIKEFSRFTGLLMFGSFSVINIIVLLNLLIAMMNHSYQLISVSSVSIAWALDVRDSFFFNFFLFYCSPTKDALWLSTHKTYLNFSLSLIINI